jgi:hypothetical protein
MRAILIHQTNRLSNSFEKNQTSRIGPAFMMVARNTNLIVGDFGLGISSSRPGAAQGQHELYVLTLIC